jgi:hypothetical protein
MAERDTARVGEGAPPPRVMVLASALSMDAPVVALVWQELFARALGVTVGWPGRAVLGLAVWVVYAADRWLDGWRIPAGRAVTPRHRFAVRFRWPIAAAVAAAVACGLVVAVGWLEAHVVHVGLGVGGAVAAYLALNQATPRGWGLRVPKEVAAAALFAVGTVLLPVARAAAVDGWVATAALLFAGICLVNLVAVAAWDRQADAAQGQASIATAAPQALRALPGAAWSACALATACAATAWTAGAGGWTVALLACCATSGLGLAVLASTEGGAGPELRALVADVVLLTPLAALAAG